MNGTGIGSIIYTSKLKKIIYKLMKNLELEENEKKIVKKIIQEA